MIAGLRALLFYAGYTVITVLWGVVSVLIAWTNTALTDEAGRGEFVVGTGIDVTEQRRAEAELAERNLALERLHEQKAEFLSMVSHELNALWRLTQRVCTTCSWSAPRVQVKPCWQVDWLVFCHR